MNGKKLLMSIEVQCLEAYQVEGRTCTVVMVPFTGTATGEYFQGKTIGIGTDTQRYRKGEPGQLSARYMLEGEDYTGTGCRIFIENSIHDEAGWHPAVVTDSKALSAWEDMELTATVDGIDGGVMVRIYQDIV